MAAINFSGIASGLDTAALIDAALDARRTTDIKPSQKRISEPQDTNKSLNTLKSKISSLQTSLRSVGSLAGGALVKNAQSADEGVVTASASQAAKNGSYTVTVGQLARNSIFSFDDRFASTSTVINPMINDGAGAPARTVTIEVGQGSNKEPVNVELTSTTTVDQFISSYNTNATKSSASLVNVGTSTAPSYALMISSNEQGLEKGQMTVTVGSEIRTAGTGAFPNDTPTQAKDAEFQVSGITGNIVRSSNKITDVLTGLTMDLGSLGSTTVTISDDTDASAAAVRELVDSYNEIVGIVAEGNKIEREEDSKGVTNIFGPLSSTRVDDDLLSAIRSSIANTAVSGGTQVRILADLGITTERDGTLKFDDEKFEEAMAKEPSSVNSAIMQFSDTLALSGGIIDNYNRFNGLFDVSINSNQTIVDGLNERISEIEKQLTREKESLTARYARLESLMGQLQSQQSALNSALAGLG